MRERELSELEIAAAFQAFLDDAPTEIQPVVLVDQLARVHRAAGRHTRRWWSIFVPPPDRNPALRLAWLVVLIGLLLATSVSGIYVASELRRLAEERVVVPPAVTPAPSASHASTEDPWAFEPTVSDTPLGTITWRVYSGSYLVPDIDTPHGPVGLAPGDPDVNLIYPNGVTYADGVTHPSCALSCLFWAGPDGTWAEESLPVETSGLVPVGDDLIAYSDGSAWRVSWVGGRWVLGDRLGVPPHVFDLEGFPLEVAAGPRGVLFVGGDLAAAPDGRHFVSVEELPGGSDARVAMIGPVVATADGFIALVSPGELYIRTDEPSFEPIPWVSPDGLTWEPAAPTSPFGEGSWIREVACRDGRCIAVGNTGSEAGPWAAWASDNGRTWEPLHVLGLNGDQYRNPEDPDPSPSQIGIAAGDAGWVISTGRHQSLWVSADGLAWERLAVPGMSIENAWGGLPRLALAGDTIVVTGRVGRTSASAVGTITP